MNNIDDYKSYLLSSNELVQFPLAVLIKATTLEMQFEIEDNFKLKIDLIIGKQNCKNQFFYIVESQRKMSKICLGVRKVILSHDTV